MNEADSHSKHEKFLKKRDTMKNVSTLHGYFKEMAGHGSMDKSVCDVKRVRNEQRMLEKMKKTSLDVHV